MAHDHSTGNKVEMPPFASWTVFNSMVTDKRTDNSY